MANAAKTDFFCAATKDGAVVADSVDAAVFGVTTHVHTEIYTLVVNTAKFRSAVGAGVRYAEISDTGKAKGARKLTYGAWDTAAAFDARGVARTDGFVVGLSVAIVVDAVTQLGCRPNFAVAGDLSRGTGRDPKLASPNIGAAALLAGNRVFVGCAVAVIVEAVAAIVGG